MNFFIKRILIAHECVIDREHKCEYPRGRGSFGLVFALGGEAEYKFTNGERAVIRAGEIMLLSPSAAYSVSVKGGFRHYTVNFDGDGELDILNRSYVIFSSDNSEEYRLLFKRAVGAYKSRQTGYSMLVSSQIYAIFSGLNYEISEKVQNVGKRRRLAPARQYIDEHFTESVSLSELAALSNMSLTSFRREWRGTFGDTPIKYRDEKRLSLAKDMLLEGRMSVGEIALVCGFEDASYFVRFFKKHTGFTPTEYKKSLAIM
ncbi:MAG: helix-turn-helix transcriptional regulator [Clostridia bacterium]|nr:helix-turn-helix transcriptional regulator [Clostridia bacterium]